MQYGEGMEAHSIVTIEIIFLQQTLIKLLRKYHHLDVNVVDPNLGMAPIHSIVKKERKDRLQLLLALLVHSNVDVNLMAHDGNTPLHMIIQVHSCKL